MKELGIVSTKKGLMFNAPQIKIPVGKQKENKNESKKEISKEGSKESGKEKVIKQPVQKVVIVNRSGNKEEQKRLEARGIY